MSQQTSVEFDFTATPETVNPGGSVQLHATPVDTKRYTYKWTIEPTPKGKVVDPDDPMTVWQTAGDEKPQDYRVMVRILRRQNGDVIEPTDFYGATVERTVHVVALAGPGSGNGAGGLPDGAAGIPGGTPVPVTLTRTAQLPTLDQGLWTAIRNRTNAISFRNYRSFMDDVMATPSYGPYAYELLKQATDAFLMHETGVIPGSQMQDWIERHPKYPLDPGRARLDPSLEDGRMKNMADGELTRFQVEEARRLGYVPTYKGLQDMREAYYDKLQQEKILVLPYLDIIRQRLADIPIKPVGETPGSTYGILRSRLTGPVAIELIWSYWHEEGMLVQTLNAILARFQNRRLVEGRDPLARFDLDPLRPLNNIFWGWAQDEIHRMTVRRRAYEYDHEYGLRLYGKAVPEMSSVDSRSKFLGAFHNLLHLTHVFFKEDDDTTVIADGFPVLNALREVHLLLAEGAHNQFGDLPSSARAVLMINEWMLARPAIREFLGGRIMVPYEETWMDRVDSVKSMYGWTDTSITHFRDLGVYGEQIILSARYGNWSTVNDPQQAANWARYWRPEIQRYVHAYRSATGVDLTQTVDTVRPGVHLQRRLAAQGRPR
jgi:hypothetical protein